MPVRIKTEKKDDTIPMVEMKKGQIAVVVRTPYGESKEGHIITRTPTPGGGDMFVTIGLGQYYGGQEGYRVRILPPGTELVID